MLIKAAKFPLHCFSFLIDYTRVKSTFFKKAICFKSISFRMKALGSFVNSFHDCIAHFSETLYFFRNIRITLQMNYSELTFSLQHQNQYSKVIASSIQGWF
jgi:hypothetical protein